MIDVKQILSEFKSFFENLINIRALNGRIVESNSYSYTPELLTKDDFGLIFASIMKWLFPNQDVGLQISDAMPTNQAGI